MVGMGALAFGSGALFTSAAFESSVTPDADFRVVVDERLLVQAGAAFRGNQPDGTFDPGTDSTKFAGADGTERPIFEDNTGLEGFNAFDLPKMSANGGDNDDLIVENAVLNEEGVINFKNSLQIRSQSDTSVIIGIEIQEYGADGDFSSDSTGDHISRSRVRDIYKFWLHESDGSMYDGTPDPDQLISTGGADDTNI